MNKLKLLSIIFSIFIAAIDCLFLIYFIPAFIAVLTNSGFFSSHHSVILICVLVLNIMYFGYTTFILIKNKVITNKKIKSINNLNKE